MRARPGGGSRIHRGIFERASAPRVTRDKSVLKALWFSLACSLPVGLLAGVKKHLLSTSRESV